MTMALRVILLCLGVDLCATLRAGTVLCRIESGATSKGMHSVALVELGSGCCRGGDSTKAAIRACNDAIEWNSVKVRTIIPGGYEAMRLHVQCCVHCMRRVLLLVSRLWGTQPQCWVRWEAWLSSSRV